MYLNSTASAYGIKVFGFITGGTYVVGGDKYRIVVDNESCLGIVRLKVFQDLYKLCSMSLDVEVLYGRSRKP